MTRLEKARYLASVLDSKKAFDIDVLEVTDLTSIADYFVIASASNSNHVSALAEEVEDKMTLKGKEPKKVEKDNSSEWIILDYYDVIVHIFFEETRKFYSLEKLWSDAPKLDVSDIVK